MARTKLAIAIIIVAVVFAASFLTGTLFTMYKSEEGYSGGFISRESPITELTRTVSTSKDLMPSTVNQERMVIYNGYISLETSDITGALDKIRSLAERSGGYVSGTSRSIAGNRTIADITIRIPQDKFRASINEIATYGKVLDERSNSDDVTEQYIDLKAKLKNLQIVEQSLSEVLAKAQTVDEILKVEAELGRIRGEIDSLQGQINYIERNVAMSVITAHLSEPPPTFTPPGWSWGETFETAITGLFIVIRGLIILVITLLPLAIIIGVPAYYLHRRKKMKSQTKE